VALSGPTLDVGNGSINFEKSVTASWQQRWLIDDGNLPTISTVVSVQLPYDEPDEKTDVVFTAIVAESTQWGAVYPNTFAESTDGADFSAADFGGVLGAKRILNDHLALFADVAVYEDGAYALELSVERDFENGSTIGPGITLSHVGDGFKASDLMIGFVMSKVFGDSY
jgi:hypothetical protein